MKVFKIKEVKCMQEGCERIIERSVVQKKKTILCIEHRVIADDQYQRRRYRKKFPIVKRKKLIAYEYEWSYETKRYEKKGS